MQLPWLLILPLVRPQPSMNMMSSRAISSQDAIWMHPPTLIRAEEDKNLMIAMRVVPKLPEVPNTRSSRWGLLIDCPRA